MFFAYASKVMRSIIMDYVRQRSARNCGGGLASVTLNTGIEDTAFSGPQLLRWTPPCERRNRWTSAATIFARCISTQA
ncbi:hypothetical protein [Hydrocarboniphaga sp.]|uniref:hypothetical protein n=1 Tax=Hydrocarboniphaga sp. TaxID=2033016 RepID=UPI003455A18A